MAVSPRIKAQWRQIDKEHADACNIRREWMKISGFSDAEIEKAIAEAIDLTVLEELAKLERAYSCA